MMVAERDLDPRAAVTANVEALESRIRGLAAWTIHNADHLRESRDGLKVGGHQASCLDVDDHGRSLFHCVAPA
jgi:pyruvate dehydrogenase E1 component